jgi:hypothetical protein
MDCRSVLPVALKAPPRNGRFPLVFFGRSKLALGLIGALTLALAANPVRAGITLIGGPITAGGLHFYQL